MARECEWGPTQLLGVKAVGAFLGVVLLGWEGAGEALRIKMVSESILIYQVTISLTDFFFAFHLAIMKINLIFDKFY